MLVLNSDGTTSESTMSPEQAHILVEQYNQILKSGVTASQIETGAAQGKYSGYFVTSKDSDTLTYVKGGMIDAIVSNFTDTDLYKTGQYKKATQFSKYIGQFNQRSMITETISYDAQNTTQTQSTVATSNESSTSSQATTSSNPTTDTKTANGDTTQTNSTTTSDSAAQANAATTTNTVTTTNGDTTQTQSTVATSNESSTSSQATTSSNPTTDTKTANGDTTLTTNALNKPDTEPGIVQQTTQTQTQTIVSDSMAPTVTDPTVQSTGLGIVQQATAEQTFTLPSSGATTNQILSTDLLGTGNTRGASQSSTQQTQDPTIQMKAVTEMIGGLR